MCPYRELLIHVSVYEYITDPFTFTEVYQHLAVKCIYHLLKKNHR